MADSITERIAKAVLAQLQASGKPPGTEVNRERRQTVTKDSLPMLSVYFLEERPKPATAGPTSPKMDRPLRLVIRCRALGTQENLDPLRIWVLAALGEDPSFGGLALSLIEESTNWLADDDSEFDYSICDIQFAIRYATWRFDLTKS